MSLLALDEPSVAPASRSSHAFNAGTSGEIDAAFTATAKVLGLTVPPTLQYAADEVIEYRCRWCGA
jgi:hypothetical protein